MAHNIYQYQLNYNHNHRPISVWDGTTHTDIVYNDDDDIDDDYTDYAYDDYDQCGATYDYAYGDSFNMNDPSAQTQFQKCLQIVQFQNRFQAAQHIDTTTTKHTTMKHIHIHKDSQPPYKYDTLQL